MLKTAIIPRRNASIPDYDHIADKLILIVPSEWDDEGYQTTFYMYLDDRESDSDNRQYIGNLKIGFLNQTKDQKTKDQTFFIEKINKFMDKDSKQFFFEKLPETFYSMGDSSEFYFKLREMLGEYNNKYILSYLKNFNDIAYLYSKNIFNKNIQDFILSDVFKYSFLRFVSFEAITDRFSQIALGEKDRKEQFNINFFFKENFIEFKVYPDSSPPTNIHIIIGSNGVGKSIFLDEITQNYINKDFGFNDITNLIILSYSPFEKLYSYKKYFLRYTSLFKHSTDEKEKARKINFISFRKFTIRNSNIIDESYISNLNPKNIDKNIEIIDQSHEQFNEIKLSLMLCYKSKDKERRLKNIFSIISKFYNSYEINITSFFNLKEFTVLKDKSWLDKAENLYFQLSSGHKVVLYSLIKLVSYVEDNNLIIYDEPEAYLHPPLLSAYIRAISWLLTDCNAMAIMATHSPVVLQEVPSECVKVMYRTEENIYFESSDIETFGENIGILTSKVFKLEFEYSGFYNLIRDFYKENYKLYNSREQAYQALMDKFNNKLGVEGRSIARNLAREFTNKN